MAADPSKLSFFSLPGEIRNKIMNLVLVPGDVYPHTPVPKISTRVPISAANVESRSGVQLIATCRQAYDEGHVLFYSSNTFHLPATETFEWSDRLQPKHKYLIKRISITIGPNELDASMISHIEEEAYMFRILNSSEFGDESDGVLEAEYNAIEQAVKNTFGKAWNSKMRHMAAWSSLEDITLCLFKETEIPTIPPRHKCNLQYHKRTIQHYELVANLGDMGIWQSRYWHEILWWPHILVVANIAAKAHENASATWAATIEWLYVREPGELAGRFWREVEYLPLFTTLEGSLIRLLTG